MKNKEIQEQRVRTYFIDAAKSLLKGEGLRSVNVRSISEQAGYSYATLYNYFKDLNELIFICVNDFQDECATIIAQKTKKEEDGMKHLKTTVKAYAEYFVEYPGVFELFFVERMGTMNNRKDISALIYTFLDRLCEKDWACLLKTKQLDEEQVKAKKEQLRFTITGMLLYYIHRLQPESYIEFMETLDQQIDGILDI